MANSINNNFLLRYKSTEQLGKNMFKGSKEKASEAKDPLAQFGGSASVELSQEGLALAVQQKNDKGDGGDASGGVKSGEEALSPKAQDFLAKLREKYGDYDFFVADNVENPLDFDGAGNSNKRYYVILSNEELEKMADDEEYANKVMGQVEKAIGVADKLESEGKLGEGVSFSKIAITIDAEGNMKLFAELERASQEQQERLEKAQEKKEDEAAKADKEKEKEAEEEQPPLSLQHTRIEADSEDEFWEKILGIDWSKIAFD